MSSRAGLTDAQYHAIEDRLRDVVETWTFRLGLRWWHIKTALDTDAASFEHFGDERDSAAFRTTTHMEVVSDWQRMEATIRINAYSVLEADDETLEEWIVHELCHVLVSEMRISAWADAPETVIHSQMEHEERVVSMLTKAFGWTYLAGPSELTDPNVETSADEGESRADE